MSAGRGKPPDGEEALYDLPEGLKNIPLERGRRAGPDDHPSFDEFWASLGKEDNRENRRLQELFFEWLGQNGYDVHRPDEPTIIGDQRSWLRVWERYLKTRKLK
jgi:hypothetical protein